LEGSTNYQNGDLREESFCRATQPRVHLCRFCPLGFDLRRYPGDHLGGAHCLTGYFSKIQVYSVIFIAMLLAFFVEPIMERIKNGSWELEQPCCTVAYAMLEAKSSSIRTLPAKEP